MIEVLAGIALLTILVVVHQMFVLRYKINSLEKSSEPDPQGYSKFIEDSRDAAFGYIEQVQLAILDLKQKTDEKNRAAIKESYNNLISLLPEDK